MTQSGQFERMPAIHCALLIQVNRLTDLCDLDTNIFSRGNLRRKKWYELLKWFS